MQVFPQVSAGFGLDLQGKEGKNTTKPCTLFMLSSSEEPRMLKLKPLGAACPWGAARRAADGASWQAHPTPGVPTQAGCLNGFSMRAWRQLGDLTAESGAVWCRQRPCRWRQALQLHDAWHTPLRPPSQHRQAWGDTGSPQQLHSS